MKEYDVVQEASTIVNEAFGYDYYDAVDYLVKLDKHTRGCGCRSCRLEYDNELDRVASQFRAPDGEIYVAPPTEEEEVYGYHDDDGSYHYYPMT